MSQVAKKRSPSPARRRPRATAPKAAAEAPAAADLESVVELSDFLQTVGDLSLDERLLLVDQALLLIEQFYVHLSLKRAMHAVDPLQRLKLLRHRCGSLPAHRFHQELIAIFMDLRDLHTNYFLPQPFQKARAFLPLLLEEYYEEPAGSPHYLVSRTTVSDGSFKKGVRVTHWNGVPIERAVELHGARSGGSNEEARRARGLATLTVRPLFLMAPPDEHWVVVGYRAGSSGREIRLPWQVSLEGELPAGLGPEAAGMPLSCCLGLDAAAEAVQQVRRRLFAPGSLRAERRWTELRARGNRALAAAAADPELAGQSRMPHNFRYRTVTVVGRKIGHVRLWTFTMPAGQYGPSQAELDRFLNDFQTEFLRILRLLPQDGLILDIRSNPGGVIMASERLLQLLTPRTIEPQLFQFATTPATLRLCDRDFLADWKDSIAEAVETGAGFSRGFPFESPAEANRVGQQYHGSVVLITDARCYSAADIFAAGFQDHAIGKVLGTAGNTGAGGANVWGHDALRAFSGADESLLKPLPGEAAFRVALRRCLRVGERSGMLVEDLGVRPDEIHYLTARDLLEDNKDLMAAAARLLGQGTARSLGIEVARQAGDKATVTAVTTNLDRLDVYLDDRPRLSLDVRDGTTAFELPLGAAGPHVLDVRGYAIEELVAARRVSL